MAGDYMMRMIEQIAAMLASMIGKKAAGKVAEARVELRNHPYIRERLLAQKNSESAN